MAVASRLSVGTVVGSELSLLFAPKVTPPRQRHPVMFVHGAGSTAPYCIDRYGRQAENTYAHLAQPRFGHAGDNGGTQTWGNDTSVARLDDAYDYLQTIPGADTGLVILNGSSMGGVVALNWASRNPEKVAAITLVVPTLNLTDIVTNNRGGLASLVNAAYSGGWSEGTWGATNNPQTLAAAGAFDGLPMLLTYGTSDTLCLPGEAVTFAASVGDTCTLSPVPYGHEAAAYENVNRDQIRAFVEQWGE